MPFFKTTYNILKKYDEDELFDPNWMDSDKLILPPQREWDYSREIQIEDVDIWEVLYEATDGVGVYASWSPYAEFYMITTGHDRNSYRIIDYINYYDRFIETYYGNNVQNRVQERMRQLGIPFSTNKIWVNDDKMWLYTKNAKKESENILILPG